MRLFRTKTFLKEYAKLKISDTHYAKYLQYLALLLQEESMVNSILDKLEIDTMLLTDSVLELIELPESQSTLSPAYQIYLNPDLAQVI